MQLLISPRPRVLLLLGNPRLELSKVSALSRSKLLPDQARWAASKAIRPKLPLRKCLAEDQVLTAAQVLDTKSSCSILDLSTLGARLLCCPVAKDHWTVLQQQQ